MDALAALRKRGFRRWYEHTLIEAHAWLISCFLAMVLALALFEAHNDAPALGQRIPLLVGAVFCVMGAWAAYRRYFLTLQRAEIMAEAAVCPQCGTYGRFRILAGSENESGDLNHLSACCLKCQKKWQLDA